MLPKDIPETAPRPDAGKSQAVEGAFTTLVQSLRAAAVEPGADFARCAAYLQAVETLEGRWKRAEAPHGRRGQKGAVS